MLSFGTAGLRGPVRPGPDGMNAETVARTTAGLAAWLIGRGAAGEIVVVGRDARHGSAEFATVTCEVLAAAGFDVVALPDPGPTPLVAFATRALDAAAGVMITASHNPPGDNGYKVYLGADVADPAGRGAQLTGPADREIEAAIGAAGEVSLPARQRVVPDARARAVRADYLAALDRRFAGHPRGPLRIALTPMHGVGGELAVEALRRNGFDDVHVVAEQFAPDPDFPTVAYPNPEEPGAADRLLRLAADVGADLAIALDPDADRCAIGVAGTEGWRMLTGDETGALLGTWVLDRLPAGGPTPVVASSIVSGTLLHTAARQRGAVSRRTLTGFKWLVRAGEPLVYAYEEALGHCVDPAVVRDKDGISATVASALLAAAWAGRGGLPAALAELAARHGEHVTAPRSLRLDEPAEIAAIMTALRTDPPRSLAGVPVSCTDFACRTDGPTTDGVELVGRRDDGVEVRVFARPSGTEPKLKYYGQVSAPPATGNLSPTRHELSQLLARALADLPPTGSGEGHRR
ncbi:phospho-sugar mutase [Gordonia aichiensis]|uniref:phospho-sugar mutase n=2 Tax=Gordonia TaxID=2053 RepID=UPI0032651A52